MPSIPTTIVPNWPTAAHRAAEPLRVAGFVLGVLALEILLAHGISGPKISRYVYLFVGLFAIAFVFRFPTATALFFFGFTDFIFYHSYFVYHLGSINVYPQELALAGLLALAVFRPQKRTWGGTAGLALAAFLALVAISAALAVEGGRTTLTDAWNWARPLGLLTFFYVVIRLFPSPKQRRTLMTGVAVLAALTGVVALTVALGASFGKSLEEVGSNTITHQPGFGSVSRVRLVGLSAGYALFWFTAVQIAARRGIRRWGWSLLLAGMGLDIIVSFNRNMWIGIIIGMVLMGILGGPLVRSRLIGAMAVVVAGLAMFFVFGTSSVSNSTVEPFIDRGETLFNPAKTSKEGSLQARASETSLGWASFKRHPLLGVGAGASFGVFMVEPVEVGSLFFGYQHIPQLFLHNQYLYLLLIAGIPGLLAFLVFLGTPLTYSLRRVPRDPPIIACGIGIALIMISAVVAIYFTVDDMTAILGLLSGVIVADAEGRAKIGKSSGLIAKS